MASIGDFPLPARPPRYRSKVGLCVLFVALGLGPVAWIAQLIVVYIINSNACYPDGAPLLDIARAGFWWALLVINLLGIVLAAIAGLTSWRNYRVARATPTGGDSEIRVRVEGRSAFLAGWGGLAGLGFFAGAIFDLIALVVVPPCLG